MMLVNMELRMGDLVMLDGDLFIFIRLDGPLYDFVDTKCHVWRRPGWYKGRIVARVEEALG